MHKDERNYVHQSFVATHKLGKCAVTAWSMRGSRNFRQGGPGQSDKKALTTFFFCFVFLVQRNTFSSVVQLFPGRGGRWGLIAYPHIETHITCDFPGGGCQTPCPPSGSALVVIPETCGQKIKAPAVPRLCGP